MLPNLPHSRHLQPFSSLAICFLATTAHVQLLAPACGHCCYSFSRSNRSLCLSVTGIKRHLFLFSSLLSWRLISHGKSSDLMRIFLIRAGKDREHGTIFCRKKKEKSTFISSEEFWSNLLIFMKSKQKKINHFDFFISATSKCFILISLCVNIILIHCITIFLLY